MANCPKRATTGTRASVDFLYWSERDAIRSAVFEVGPPLCVWCNEAVGGHRHDRPFTADHIVPRSEGGAYATENLALSCKRCNVDRGNEGLLQYLLRRAVRYDGTAVPR